MRYLWRAMVVVNRAKLRRILKKLAVVALPALLATRLVTCSACPLSGCCPVVAVAAGGLFGSLSVLLARLKRGVLSIRGRGRELARTALFYGLLLSAVGLAFVGALQAADILTVEPTTVAAAVGDAVNVTAVVEFLHPQPCPYPSWRLECNATGDVRVLSVSEPEVSADGMSAKWTIKLQVNGNGTVNVVYHYGEGCPFGDVENVTVEVIGLAPGGAEVETPSQPLAQRIEKSLNSLLGLRTSLLYGISALALIVLASRLGKPAHVDEKGVAVKGSRVLTNVRYAFLAAVTLIFVAVPIVAKGYICPFCPLAVPQYLFLYLRTSFPPFSLLNPYIAVPLIAFGVSVLFVRSWCGWICPLGAVQDLLALGHAEVKVPEELDRKLRWLKFVALAAIIGLVLLTATAWLCEHCPLRTMTTTANALAAPASALGKVLLAIGVVTLLLSAIVPRFFCRYGCPLGALLEILARAGIRGAKIITNDRCKNCRICLATKNCPMRFKKPGDSECISCGRCIEDCPFGAVEFSLKR